MCSCNDPCLYNLSWLELVSLYKTHDVTHNLLTCLGVNKEHHNNIIYNMRAGGDGRYNQCYIKGKFCMIGELDVNIRMFRSLLPYLQCNHVTQVELYGGSIFNNDVVNDINDILCNVVCNELMITVKWSSNLTTTRVVNMLVNVNNVDNVVIFDCHDVDIVELRNIYPHITFTQC